MIGMDRATGKPLTGADHIRQSIEDILGTPKGTRVGRRDYGSDLPELLDQPFNITTRMRVIAAAVDALGRQEERISISRIAMETGDEPGTATLIVAGTRTDINGASPALTLSVIVRARSALAS